jgi:hypothetical protein
VRFTILFGLAFIVSACGGAQVAVRNQSSTRLQDVTVVAAGDSVKINLVEPSSEQRTSICPKGEAGSIQLSFTADGQVYRTEEALYFECNSSYAITLNVSPHFEVSAVVGIK